MLNRGRGHSAFTFRPFAAPLLLSLLCAVSPSLATRVRPINLEEMTDLAGRIFSGRVAEVREVAEPGRGRPVTLVTIEVDRVVKGRVGRTVTFRQRAGVDPRSGARGGVIGMPRYREGEEVILFLATEGSTGLTSTLGLGQGKFVIRDDGKGRRYAANEFANRTLFVGLSADGTKRLESVLQQWRGRRGVPPEVLLNMVETLERRP